MKRTVYVLQFYDCAGNWLRVFATEAGAEAAGVKYVNERNAADDIVPVTTFAEAKKAVADDESLFIEDCLVEP